MMRRIGRLERIARCFMYLGLAVAGIGGFVYPSDMVQSAVSTSTVFWWTGSMAISALLAFWGTARDYWLGEYAGLPLMIAVLTMYGVVTVQAATGTAPARVAYGILILSYACGLFARWLYLNKIRLANLEAVADKRHGEG